MDESGWLSSTELAAAYDSDQQTLTGHDTASERALRRKYTTRLKKASPEYVMDFAWGIFHGYGYRWQAYEIISGHQAAFKRLDAELLEEFGQGINSWWTTDAFGRTMAGPAWKEGLVTDELIVKWAHSPDLWWRRAALVSTVAFNLRSQGGKGDTQRTLLICRLLAADRQDMVLKALSWALRELVYFDQQAVEGFLREYDGVLAGRVKREVGNKLRTGLKNPRKAVGC
jgi:3-methyladenine DNA glycosylase AlkD